MKSKIDIGQRFGMLTVIEKANLITDKYVYYGYNCRCDCGNERHIQASILARGIQKSCGCNRGTKSKFKKQYVTTVQAIGNRYGSLVVVDFGSTRMKAMVRCDCGNVTEKTLYSVVRGQTTSCGCGIYRHKKRIATYEAKANEKNEAKP